MNTVQSNPTVVGTPRTRTLGPASVPARRNHDLVEKLGKCAVGAFKVHRQVLVMFLFDDGLVVTIVVALLGFAAVRRHHNQ